MPSSKLPRGAFDARASLVAATLGLGLPAAAGAAQAVPPVSAPPVAPSAVSESELVGAELPPAPDVEASVLWVDWSGDGKDDVWAVQPDGSGLLLQNAGDGTFSDRTPGSGLIDVTGIHRAAWADVDRDGRLDVFLGSWNGPSYLFLQSGDGTFVDVTRASGLSPQVRPVEAQWIDFDGDGWLDLHLANLREDVVYRGLGRAQFERVELGLVPRVSLPSGVVPFPSTGVGSIDPYGAPDAARPIGSGASLGSSSGSITSITGTSANPSGSSSSICAGSIEDLAGGACLNASSAPQLGMLYPLSSNLFVAGNGFVGLGTTSGLNQRLTVAGGIQSQRLVLTTGTGTAPMTVNSSTRVTNLNADLLDGFSSGDFMPAGASIGSGQILDGSILNVDVSATAAIEGSKISPDFGNQTVESDVAFVVGTSAVQGEMSPLLVAGYLGVAASDDFGGYDTVDWAGLDVGAAGISLGGSNADNYGVIGHANTVGVRGEHSVNPSSNFGELGVEGIGIRARGTSAAAEFTGLLDVTHSSRAVDISGGTATFSTGRIVNPTGGPTLRLQSETVGATSTDPCLNVNTQSRGQGVLVTQSNPSALQPALQLSSFATSAGHRVISATKTGAAAGAAGEFRLASSTSTAPSLIASTAGTGSGVEASSAEGLAIDANRTGNSGTILQARNSGDIEFRVDSSGDVFCDLAFNGGGADYAEWLPVAAGESRAFQKGDVVGIHGGEISHDVEDADVILVISTNPCLVGNTGGSEAPERENHEIVAFLGQVPVRMRGRVRAGDLVLPSGRGDGTAVAVAPSDLAPARLGDVIGRAWGDATPAGDEVHRVVCAVGLERDRIAALALGAVQTEVEDLRASMETILTRLEALEAR